MKPFDTAELLARMRAVQRRQAGAAGSVVEAGRSRSTSQADAMSYRGVSAVLPAREFALMSTFAARAGAILSRGEIEDRIYGWGEEVESNAVDVLIHSIRKKFDKDVVRNVRGAGWLVPK